MKLIVKDVDLETGDNPVVIMNKKDAQKLDLHHMDRVLVTKGRKSIVAVTDIGESSKVVSPGHIGLFEEVLSATGAVDKDTVTITPERKPESTVFIRKKLDGDELSYKEILAIITDIVNRRLTEIEISTYVAANYTRGMSMNEIVALTRAMTATGTVLRWKEKEIVDFHSIGGVPGNRTTMIVVPICVAAGLKMPKTSSRAITSPAGTSDTMEYLAPVSLPENKLKQILTKVGGFLAWGGAVRLAPADDLIIHIEHPLNIDAEGEMIASIMAKKASVSATHLLMELPWGRGSKVKTLKNAQRLARVFGTIGKKLGIKMKVVLCAGDQPVGSGIGVAPEARDCLWVLMNHKNAPSDLRDKSLSLAGQLLEFTGRALPGKGFAMAGEILTSGKAYRKMVEIIRAQGGTVTRPEQVRLGRWTGIIRAKKSGVVTHVENGLITKIARMAGAPRDKGAGVYLHVRKGSRVAKGDPLFTIYADNHAELNDTAQLAQKLNGRIIVVR